MNNAQNNINLSYGNDGINNTALDLFVNKSYLEGYNGSISFSSTSTDEPDIAYFMSIEGWEFVTWNFQPNAKRLSALMATDIGSYVHVFWEGHKIHFSISCEDIKDGLETKEVCEKLFPKTVLKQNPEEVPLSFWSLASNGARSNRKKVNPLLWKDIEANYTKETASKLDTLRQTSPPILGGRLILWHGPPGTGKSSALRNLIHEWLPWCDASYVLDAENFFGNANYMTSVLLNDDPDDFMYDDDYEYMDELDLQCSYVLQGSDRWNLLIVEDADEFLRSDAKERTGQSLSRLLNLSDGLIGQGLNFLVLITTNEEIGNIHTAVAREGRCMAKIHFSPFTHSEAQDWLGDNRDLLKAKPGVHNYSLASLYDLLREHRQITAEAPTQSYGTYL